MNNAYLTLDVASCRKQDHRFKTAGSDKTPMKVNLICATCTDATGKTCYVAFGEPMKSEGQWVKPSAIRERYSDFYAPDEALI